MKPEALTVSHKGEDKRIEAVFHHTGKPENPVLVFLHEGLGCARSWKAFPRTLGTLTQCNVLVYSRLGYGGSDTVPLPRKLNWFHTEALHLLPQILNALNIPQFIHIGHSDGGSIALIHAGGRRPKGLRGVVTLAAHLFCEPATIKGIREAKQRYETGDLKQRLQRIHGANTETAFWGWNRVWLSQRFIHWNIEKYTKFISVPVLALQGVDDAYGTLAQLSAMEKGIPDCRIKTIANCGHIPHLEQPQETLSLISDFISDLVSSSA